MNCENTQRSLLLEALCDVNLSKIYDVNFSAVLAIENSEKYQVPYAVNIHNVLYRITLFLGAVRDSDNKFTFVRKARA